MLSLWCNELILKIIVYETIFLYYEAINICLYILGLQTVSYFKVI